jgi:hypothetical protein
VGQIAVGANSMIVSTEAPQPQAALPVPTGYGPIRLGMSRETLEALRTGEVALTEPLRSAGGTSRYENSKLRSPLTAIPADVSFRFENNELVFFAITLSVAELSDALRQIVSKYGKPVVTSTDKEGECSYRADWDHRTAEGIYYSAGVHRYDPHRCTEDLENTKSPFRSRLLSFSRERVLVDKNNLF